MTCRRNRRLTVSTEDVAVSPAGWRAPEVLSAYDRGRADANRGKPACYGLPDDGNEADLHAYLEGHTDQLRALADDDGDAIGQMMGRNP